MSASLLEALLGGLLIFVLPGLGLSRALFPEWRFRGDAGAVHAVETFTLSVVLSVAVTILVGFALLNLPVGFSAVWANPTIELLLVLVTVPSFAVAWWRGAFASQAPVGPSLEPMGGEEGGAEAIARAESLARESRRIRHALRVNSAGTDLGRLREELETIEQEARRLGEQREAEYHG
jgi:hypothetical protein